LHICLKSYLGGSLLAQNAVARAEQNSEEISGAINISFDGMEGGW
jgi:hypothetical protein